MGSPTRLRSAVGRRLARREAPRASRRRRSAAAASRAKRSSREPPRRVLFVVPCESAGLVATASAPAGKGHSRVPVMWLKKCHREVCPGPLSDVLADTRALLPSVAFDTIHGTLFNPGPTCSQPRDIYNRGRVLLTAGCANAGEVRATVSKLLTSRRKSMTRTVGGYRVNREGVRR